MGRTSAIRQGTNWRQFQAMLLQSTEQHGQAKQQTGSSMERRSDGGVKNCDLRIDSCSEINFFEIPLHAIRLANGLRIHQIVNF